MFLDDIIGPDLLNEKSVSKAQFRTMAAAAHNPEFAKKVGIKQSVAKEFHGADRKQDYKDLPKKVNELFEPTTDYYTLSNGKVVQVDYRSGLNGAVSNTIKISYADPKVTPHIQPKTWEMAPLDVKRSIVQWASSPEAKQPAQVPPSQQVAQQQGVAEGDREFRNQERNAGLEPEDNGTYSIWTQGAKDDKPKSIITKQCSMDDAERHARSIKKKYPFLKVWMQAHHLGKSGFFPMNEDSWSDGQSQWSSEHDQWTKEGLEPQNDSRDAVYNAILRRIIGGHASLLSQFGPERVMSAVEDVADWNSDVEEIGSSDVSGWVRQVFQKLQNNEY